MKNVDAFCNVFKHREEEDETDFRAYIFEIKIKKRLVRNANVFLREGKEHS